MPIGDVADDEPEGREVVGGLERLGVAEVDLVLARRDLVMPRLDSNPIETRSLMMRRRISSARSTGVWSK